MKLLSNIFIIGIVVLLSLICGYFFESIAFFLEKHFEGAATIATGIVAISIFYIEQRNKKINAARLVLKEIDGAIPIVKLIADNRYDQKMIAIATDNWPNQINYFVKEMTQNEIDQINKVYSYGKYINKCIERIDDYKKTSRENIYKDQLMKPENKNKKPVDIFNDPLVIQEISRFDDVPNALINFAKEAANEIKDVESWSGYEKLQRIAKLK